jgi:hypothetical protein
LSETVKRVVRLGLLADETTESIGGEGVGETTFSIDITNVDLDRGVVLGSDETVGGRAKMILLHKTPFYTEKKKKTLTTCEECKDR